MAKNTWNKTFQTWNAITEMARNIAQNKYETRNADTVDRIVVSGPATIVFWADGTKTVVKCSDDVPFDLYTAFCAATAKKYYGSNSQIHKVLGRKVQYQSVRESEERTVPSLTETIKEACKSLRLYAKSVSDTVKPKQDPLPIWHGETPQVVPTNKWTLLDDAEPVYTPELVNPYKDDLASAEPPVQNRTERDRKPFKLGDRVKLRWPEHEKPDVLADFEHTCLIVIPEDENGMVCVLVGDGNGLRRRDIQAERLELYD